MILKAVLHLVHFRSPTNIVMCQNSEWEVKNYAALLFLLAEVTWCLADIQFRVIIGLVV